MTTNSELSITLHTVECADGEWLASLDLDEPVWAINPTRGYGAACGWCFKSPRLPVAVVGLLAYIAQCFDEVCHELALREVRR